MAGGGSKSAKADSKRPAGAPTSLPATQTAPDTDALNAERAFAVDAGGKPTGILTGKIPKKDIDKLGINLFDASQNLSVEYLFGALDGAPLVDAILDWFTDADLDVGWYFSAGDGSTCRSIQRSPHSRELQERTVQIYKERICREGLSQRVAGLATFHWGVCELAVCSAGAGLCLRILV